MRLPCPKCQHETAADSGAPMLYDPGPNVEWPWDFDPGPHQCGNCGAVFETGVMDMQVIGDEQIANMGFRLISPCAAAT